MPSEDGIELRMWLAEPSGRCLSPRGGAIWPGPTGCGLCGIESLAEAMRPPPAWHSDLARLGRGIAAAIAPSARRARRSTSETRAVHAAAFWEPRPGHRRAARGCRPAQRARQARRRAGAAGISAARGVVLLTSRVSVELVQKAAMGAPVVVAVSAPTALAVRIAEAAGITLVAIARDDGFEIFTHGDALTNRTQVAEHVA